MATPAQDPKAAESKDTILWRVYAVMFIILLLALLILLQIGRIQFAEGPELRKKAESYRVERKKIEAPRGNILSEDGSLLATSLPYFNVTWDTQLVPDSIFNRYVDTLAICLANYIGGEYTPGKYSVELRTARAKKSRAYPIRNNISLLELEQIKTFPIFNLSTKRDTSAPTDSAAIAQRAAVREKAMKDGTSRDYVTGLVAEKVSKRQHPFKQLARRTIGYVNTVKATAADSTASKAVDKQGNVIFGAGLEYAYNDVLAGFAGFEQMQNIGGGTWVPVEGIEKIEPKAGKDIITTLDINIQEVAHAALEEALLKHNAANGCAVVMEVATGKIKAMANLSYDAKNNRYVEDLNHAILDIVEPGSTFKIASMLALLEDEYISVDDSIYLNFGKASFLGEEMEDASAHGLNKTTIAKAFEVSSNVGIASLMDKFYNQTPTQQAAFVRHLKDMGLGAVSGIDMEGEPTPKIKGPGEAGWSGVSVPWMSIGYDLNLTPLQLLTFYNAIANKGTMMKPYLVKEIRAYGAVEKQVEPQVLKRSIASESALEQAKQLLFGVVQGAHGTAKAIRTKQYNIAGKTGTAIMNFAEHNQSGAAKKYRGSFVGFFPAENPVYSCIVVVTNPSNGFYGGVTAAPVFRKIADYCFMHSIQVHKPLNEEPIAYKNALLPDLQIGYAKDVEKVVSALNFPYKMQAKTEFVVSRVANDSLYLLNRDVQENLVPNVVGMGLRDALYLLENRRIRVSIIGAGKVKSQSVRPGVEAKRVPSITLILG